MDRTQGGEPELGLRPSDISQSSDTDADRRREDGTEGPKASHQSRARSEDVINQEDVSHIAIVEYGSESIVHVGRFVAGGYFCLCTGAAAASEDVCPHFYAENPGDFGCNHFCLIVSSFPTSGPVQGHRNNEVHVTQMLGQSELLSKEAAKPTSQPEVRMIFQLVGDSSICSSSIVKE